MLLCLMGAGGTPSSPGYGGTPSSPDQGCTHPVLAGGYPIQSWSWGGVIYPVMAGGTPSSPGWRGCPGDGVPPSRPGMGTPHPDLGWDTRSPSRPGMGYSSIRWGTLLKVEQTHTCENITSRCTTYAGGNKMIYVALLI